MYVCMYACMYVCMCVCSLVCMYVRRYVYIYIYTYIYIHTYVCLYVCIYIYVYAHACLSVCLSVCLSLSVGRSVGRSVCLAGCLSVCLYFSQLSEMKPCTVYSKQQHEQGPPPDDSLACLLVPSRIWRTNPKGTGPHPSSGGTRDLDAEFLCSFGLRPGAVTAPHPHSPALSRKRRPWSPVLFSKICILLPRPPKDDYKPSEIS